MLRVLRNVQVDSQPVDAGDYPESEFEPGTITSLVNAGWAQLIDGEPVDADAEFDGKKKPATKKKPAAKKAPAKKKPAE